MIAASFFFFFYFNHILYFHNTHNFKPMLFLKIELVLTSAGPVSILKKKACVQEKV